jgi:hypothetical protein
MQPRWKRTGVRTVLLESSSCCTLAQDVLARVKEAARSSKQYLPEYVATLIAQKISASSGEGNCTTRLKRAASGCATWQMT